MKKNIKKILKLLSPPIVIILSKKIVNVLLNRKEPIGQMQAKPYEFFTWLWFANAGMLNNGNMYCFEYAIEHLPSNNPIIEIGSFCGLSTNVISFYILKNNKSNKLITTDKWIFENSGPPDSFLDGSRITNKEYRDFVKGTYMRNVSFFSKDHLPYTIEQFSDDFFKLWKENKTETDVFGRQIQLGGKISFAYIDGNHTYEYAKRDFENVDKYLEPGGFILFDDSADNSHWEVCKVISEIKESGKYEIIINNPNYLVKKIK
ncbi:MAG: class I SAM-dependent methyltransferase [Bacteroidia bacterium]